MTDLIQQFASETHDYNDISDERRKMQIRVLRELESRTGDIAAAGAEHIQAMLKAQLESGLKPTTVRKHLSAIRPFFAWGRKQGVYSSDVVMDVQELKPPRGSGTGVPRPYSRKDMRRFWAAFDKRYPEGRPEAVDRYLKGQCGWKHVQKHAKRLQALAIVALALYGGMRRDEIFNLSAEDLDPENGYVALWGARKNQDAVSVNRAVPWRGHMREWIGAWVELREKLDPGHDRAWLSLHTEEHARTPLPHRTFELMLRKVPGGWEFHRMRHTMATEYLRAGGKLRVLQRILGHAHIDQTLAYAQLLNDDILKDAERIDGDFTDTMDDLREAA